MNSLVSKQDSTPHEVESAPRRCRFRSKATSVNEAADEQAE